MIDGNYAVPEEMAAAYRIRFIDCIHAVVSVFVFAAVAMLDQNVTGCFYPVPMEDTRKILKALPIGIGVAGTTLFGTFPTTRHRIGYPIDPH
jgi:Protein of unknown function (DUF679)